MARLLWKYPAADIPDPACSGSDPDLWFPEPGQSHLRAKIICSTCPGLRECRIYAMAHPGLHGIWGGLTARERNRVRALREQQ